MTGSGAAELDFIEELKLRRWARENYVPRGRRQIAWHPVVHEEMERKEHDIAHVEKTPTFAGALR